MEVKDRVERLVEEQRLEQEMEREREREATEGKKEVTVKELLPRLRWTTIGWSYNVRYLFSRSLTSRLTLSSYSGRARRTISTDRKPPSLLSPAAAAAT